MGTFRDEFFVWVHEESANTLCCFESAYQVASGRFGAPPCATTIRHWGASARVAHHWRAAPARRHEVSASRSRDCCVSARLCRRIALDALLVCFCDRLQQLKDLVSVRTCCWSCLSCVICCTTLGA